MATPAPELSIDPEKVVFIAMKAREFEAKTEAAGLEEGSNPSDDREVAVLEDNPDDATGEELAAALENLNEDEQFDLLALTWIGRGEFDVGDWLKARRRARALTHKHIPRYLMETPLFSEYLEEGLSLMGRDLGQIERKRL